MRRSVTKALNYRETGIRFDINEKLLSIFKTNNYCLRV